MPKITEADLSITVADRAAAIRICREVRDNEAVGALGRLKAIELLMALKEQSRY